MLVVLVFPDISPVNVVSAHCVEGGHVTCHPGHKAGQQRRQPQPEHAAREIMQKHSGNNRVVVQHWIAFFVLHHLTGLDIHLRGNQ